MKKQRCDRMLGFHPYFDILHNQDGRVVSSTHLPHFAPKKIPYRLSGPQNY